MTESDAFEQKEIAKFFSDQRIDVSDEIVKDFTENNNHADEIKSARSIISSIITIPSPLHREAAIEVAFNNFIKIADDSNIISKYKDIARSVAEEINRNYNRFIVNKNKLLLDRGFQSYQKRDYQDALHIFNHFAAIGFGKAQYLLGQMYELGNGVKQDDAVAMSWYKKAADAGNVDAQISLGDFYAAGKGVQKDKKNACVWYSKAASQGSLDARKKLEPFVNSDIKKAIFAFVLVAFSAIAFLVGYININASKACVSSALALCD